MTYLSERARIAVVWASPFLMALPESRLIADRPGVADRDAAAIETAGVPAATDRGGRRR
jgi:hypothetical protein